MGLSFVGIKLGSLKIDQGIERELLLGQCESWVFGLEMIEGCVYAGVFTTSLCRKTVRRWLCAIRILIMIMPKVQSAGVVVKLPPLKPKNANGYQSTKTLPAPSLKSSQNISKAAV